MHGFKYTLPPFIDISVFGQPHYFSLELFSSWSNRFAIDKSHYSNRVLNDSDGWDDFRFFILFKVNKFAM